MFQKFFPGGVGSDIFGEHDTARLPYEDPINAHLRNQYLLNYFQWHFANQKTSPTFQKDLNSLYWAQKMTPVYGIAAFCFAAIVINPNYTRRRSMYLKKFNCFLFAAIGMAWGYKRETELCTNLMLRNYDYLPLEVKRVLATKDYRHMVGFNYENPSRQLWDEKTGKSLS